MNTLHQILAAVSVAASLAGVVAKTDTPQPWQRITLTGRITQEGNSPWGGGQKKFQLVTVELPGARQVEQLAFANDAEYHAAERAEGMVCKVWCVRVNRGQWSTWLAVEGIEVRK